MLMILGTGGKIELVSGLGLDVGSFWALLNLKWEVGQV